MGLQQNVSVDEVKLVYVFLKPLLLIIPIIKAHLTGWLVCLLKELGKEHIERDIARDSIYL